MPPKSEYLLFDAQPAVTIPYTLSEDSAKISRMPTFKSATIGSKRRPLRSGKGRPHGTTAIVVSAGMRPNIGASEYNHLFAPSGTMSSLRKNFAASASD